MPLTRRRVLGAFAGGAAATLLEFPLNTRLFATPEPTRHSVEGAVFLNSNENAYGPLPSASRAMQEALTGRGNRYPFALYELLRSRIAAYHVVKPEQVVFGSGSTEPLRMAAQTYCGKGKNIVVADPTFEAVPRFAEICSAEVRKAPLTSSFAHDLDGMLKCVDANTTLVYICNPNNPTGSLTLSSDLVGFLGRLPESVVTIIDEAYHHFAEGMSGYRSLMNMVSDRVIVTRTFSKIYGMAGMRLGYAISSPAVITKLQEHQLPGSVNAVAAAGGIASLDDDAAMRLAAQRNAADREEFARQATARKLGYIPSYANFYMVKVARPVKDLIAAFERNKVMVGRPFPPMNDCLRVSLGLPEEMKTFWTVWDQIQDQNTRKLSESVENA